MQIERFDLTAFGHFSDLSLDLRRPGVHLVVGANAAGKSTTQSAIGQFLFGIDRRSAYGFRHGLPNLTLGARLVGADGEAHELVRLKRNSDDLRDGDGAVVGPGVLSELCGGITREIYERLFTIGSDELVSGGDALLATEGELGLTLFGAGRASTHLHRVLADLEEREKTLFKPTGTKQVISLALANHRDALAASAEASLHPEKVIELDQEIERTEARDQDLRARRVELQTERERLERVGRVRPLLQRRAMLAANLGPHPVRLTGERLEEIRALITERSDLVARRDGAVSDRANVEHQLSEVVLSPALVDASQSVADLVAEGGAYRERLQDLPKLVERARELSETVSRLLNELPPDVAALADSVSDLQLRGLTELASKHGELLAARVRALDELEAQAAVREDTTGALERLGNIRDVSALETSLQRARAAASLATRRGELETDLAQLRRELLAETTELGIANDAAAVAATTYPPLTVIEEFAERLGSFDRDQQREQRELRRIAGELRSQRSELNHLRAERSVPEPSELDELRRERDQLWATVERVWLEGATDEAAPDALATSFSRAVAETDQQADHLLGEADRVSIAARLGHSIEELAALEAELEAAIAEISDRRDAEVERWRQLWAHTEVVVDTPAAMTSWSRRLGRARDHLMKIEDAEADLTRIEADQRQQAVELVDALALAGEDPPSITSLAVLIDHVAVRLDELADRRREHSDLTRRRDEAVAGETERRHQHDEANSHLSRWEHDWELAVVTAGVDRSLAPALVLPMLDVVGELSQTRASRQEVLGRIDGIETRNRLLEGRVKEIVEDLGIEASGDVTATIAMLDRTCQSARMAQVRHDQLTGSRAQISERIESYESQLALLGHQWDRAIEELGETTADSLGEAVAIAARELGDLDQLQDIEQVLQSQASRTIAELEQESAGVSLTGDEIDQRVRVLIQDLEALDTEHQPVLEQLVELRQRRAGIEASDAAAQHREDAETALAEARRGIEEYLQVRLARRLLLDEIAAYEREHRRPLIERTGELFSAFSLGAHSGVDVDVDDQGLSTLLALDADGGSLPMAALSSGTRHQLYFSLRLAALERTLKHRDPLPVFFDDVFEKFSDERSAAGFEILADLASRTQVVVFTHHGHLAEVAKGAIGESRLTVHNLGAEGAVIDLEDRLFEPEIELSPPSLF